MYTFSCFVVAKNVFWLTFPYNVWFYIAWKDYVIHCMGVGGLSYIVWWRASGAATSDVSRHGQKEPSVAWDEKVTKS